jgi:hypothetical protein
MAARHLPHRIAFCIVAFLLLSILALLPFALTDVIEDITQSANPTYSLVSTAPAPAASHSRINLALSSLDEWKRTATISVSGHHVCDNGCQWTDHLLFVSIPPGREDGEGLPPYAAVDFRPSALAVSQDITLPVYGDPIRYPFDHYRLRLAVVMQRVYPDGTTQTVSPQDAVGHLFLSVNGFIPRAVMDKPLPVPLSSVFVDNPAYQYVTATQLTFVRPEYLQILTVFLVLLVSAAAAYAVFLRPLSELVINAGALVLGVWGIRAILLGSNVAGFTVVDLSLMVVILFLLLAMTWRALWFLRDRSELGRPQLRHSQPLAAPREASAVNGHDQQRP